MTKKHHLHYLQSIGIPLSGTPSQSDSASPCLRSGSGAQGNPYPGKTRVTVNLHESRHWLDEMLFNKQLIFYSPHRPYLLWTSGGQVEAYLSLAAVIKLSAIVVQWVVVFVFRVKGQCTYPRKYGTCRNRTRHNRWTI